MSMRPRPLPEVDVQTAVVARAAFRKPTLAMRVRDELGEVFTDGAGLPRVFRTVLLACFHAANVLSVRPLRISYGVL
ncbi:hypothetical protein DMB66_57490 [Actinoplanes sp. ATCC 53533]|nr:hypothetical protein DMB66_57490 [Actinoplanes sp. ATCC 53533]